MQPVNPPKHLGSFRVLQCHWHTLKTLNALEVPVVGRFHLGLSQAKVQKYQRNPVPYHRNN